MLESCWKAKLNLVKTGLIYLFFLSSHLFHFLLFMAKEGACWNSEKETLAPGFRVTQLVICQILLLSTKTFPASGVSNSLLLWEVGPNSCDFLTRVSQSFHSIHSFIHSPENYQLFLWQTSLVLQTFSGDSKDEKTQFGHSAQFTASWRHLKKNYYNAMWLAS